MDCIDNSAVFFDKRQNIFECIFKNIENSTIV